MSLYSGDSHAKTKVPVLSQNRLATLVAQWPCSKGSLLSAESQYQLAVGGLVIMFILHCSAHSQTRDCSINQ